MKKKLWLLIPVFVVLSIAVYAIVGLVFFFGSQKEVGAAKGNSLAQTIYTVDFDSCGGDAVDAQHITAGNKATLPSVNKSGCEFIGWFLNLQDLEPFNFNTPINQDLTLYAKWNTIYFTVTFDTCGGNTVEPKTVVSGTKVAAPLPIWDNFGFIGWYLNLTDATPFNFNTPITQNLTLYAKWDIEFELAQDGLSYGIKKYNGNASNLVLPQEYNHLPVTYLCDFAFEDCTSLISVVLPNSLKLIDMCAFHGCNSLKSIIIPDSVDEVGASVFWGCTALTAINCQAAPNPVGWNTKWNRGCNAIVTWNYHD